MKPRPVERSNKNGGERGQPVLFTKTRAAPLARTAERRFTAKEYERMIDAGILQEGEPVELLDGLVVQKMPKKPPHRVATGLTRRALESLLPKGWYVDAQEPIHAPDFPGRAGNVPEPDIAVIRGKTEDYLDDHPPADAVALIVEVADSSLRRDRGLKKQIYAHGRIPEYWILNLAEQQLEIYQRPSGSGRKADYELSRIASLDHKVTLRIGNKTIGPIPVRSLFPKIGRRS